MAPHSASHHWTLEYSSTRRHGYEVIRNPRRVQDCNDRREYVYLPPYAQAAHPDVPSPQSIQAQGTADASRQTASGFNARGQGEFGGAIQTGMCFLRALVLRLRFQGEQCIRNLERSSETLGKYTCIHRLLCPDHTNRYTILMAFFRLRNRNEIAFDLIMAGVVITVTREALRSGILSCLVDSPSPILSLYSMRSSDKNSPNGATTVPTSTIIHRLGTLIPSSVLSQIH